MKTMKRYCLLALTMLPVASVAFAAKASLSVAQIRGGAAYDQELQNGISESWGQGGGLPGEKSNG